MYPLITITESLVIPTYYLLLSIAVCVGLIWVSQRAENAEVNRQRVLDLSLVIMVSGFLGGRLFHVFYENFDFYKEDPWRVLYFWNGGFVFYGGALLAGFCSVLYLHFTDKKNIDRYLDLFAAPLSLTYIIGRIACFFAGCCYGKYCELPWAISARHPTQLYAVFWELGSLLILLGIEKSPATSRPGLLQRTGSLFFLWMILHGTGRLLMETFRDDFRGPAWGPSVSSWISLLVILSGIILLVCNRKSRT